MRAVLSLGLSLACVGCSREATVSLKDGSTVEGEIYGSRRDAVFVSQGEAKVLAVERARIDDVTHPGVTAMISGAVLLGIGIVGIAATGDALTMDCPEGFGNIPNDCDVQGILFAFSLASAGTGLGFAVHGFSVHMKSLEDFAVDGSSLYSVRTGGGSGQAFSYMVVESSTLP